MADNRGFVYLAAIAATYLISWTLWYVHIMGWKFDYYVSYFMVGLGGLEKPTGLHMAAAASTLIFWGFFLLIRWARR